MDKEVRKLILAEEKRQQETLSLIPSENIASTDTLAALGSVFSNKYSEGYPGKRYYPGNKYVDDLEVMTQRRALKLFGLDPRRWRVNVQPYSGSPANLAIYLALVKPGDKIMGMKLADGGHLTHGHKVSATGILWRSVQYGVDPRTGKLDYQAILALARKEKPKVIVSGFTAYPRRVDFKKFREIANAVGAYHVADISHIAGLVAGGVHPSPFPFADVVMTTTHKSLRGPRGAMIFTDGRSRLAKKLGVDLPLAIDKAVFPGLQGGPHDSSTAAIAQALAEALQPRFKGYAKQIVKNALSLAKELLKRGFSLVAGGTDTHLILIDLRGKGLDGTEGQHRLEKAGIIANRNSIPGDTSPFRPSGIRLGTPLATTRGMKEKDMVLVAALIERALTGDPKVKGEVAKLCRKFPVKRLPRR